MCVVGSRGMRREITCSFLVKGGLACDFGRGR